MAKVPAEERTPYVVVAFQETERMNTLTNEIRRSLKELDLGLKVGLRYFWEKKIDLIASVNLKSTSILLYCLKIW